MTNTINLLKQCLSALNEIPNTSIDVGDHKNSYAFASHLGKEIQKYEQRGESTVNRAHHVAELSVFDPDSNLPVEVSIYKDFSSGAMFGIDSSYLMTLSSEDTVIEPFNGKDVLLLDGPYGSDVMKH